MSSARAPASGTLKVSPRCPSCERPNAVTFLPFRPGSNPARLDQQLVCLDCCPRPADPSADLRAEAEATLLRAVSATLRAERERDEAAEGNPSGEATSTASA
jgi:hypothetical protein